MTKKMKVKSYKCGDKVFFRDVFEVAYSCDYGCGGGNAEWRTSEETIKQVKNGELTGYSIARIPSECTDWFVTDYDGYESVYCIFKGLIYVWQNNNTFYADNKKYLVFTDNGHFVACGESAKKTSI